YNNAAHSTSMLKSVYRRVNRECACMTEKSEKTTESAIRPDLSEETLLHEIESCIRMTKKAYGYQHLSAIGSYLRTNHPDFSPADYGCKSLRQLIERYPERFR